MNKDFGAKAIVTKGLVNRILPFSSVDGPGNRTAIFLQGCNFNCLYCHNPETINICNNCGTCVKACPYNVLSKEETSICWNKSLCKHCDECLKSCGRNSSPKAVYMTVEEVLKEINKTRVFISGITVSGGECTLQTEFLTELFREVKKIGLSTFVDTNGSIPLYEMPELVEVMDMAMVDVKAYDNEEHLKLTGMDNSIVLENVRFLGEINKLYEVRTVVVPELLNNHYTVDMISKLLASISPDIRYKLIRYRPIGVRNGLVDSYTPSDEEMEALAEVAKNNGCRNIVLV